MKKNRFFSMKLKMSIAFSLVAVILISLYGVINFNREKKGLQESILQELSLHSEIYTEEIDSWFNIRIAALESRKTIVEQEGSLDLIISGGAEKNGCLKGNAGKYGLESFYIGLPDKRIFYGGDWNLPADFDPTSRPWYTKAVKKGDTVFTDYYIDADTGKLNISIAAPLYGETGELIGVLGTDLPLDETLALLNKAARDGVSAALIDHRGIAVVHPSKEMRGKSVGDLKDDGGLSFMNPVLSEHSGSQEYSFKGEGKIMVFHEIPSLGWKTVIFSSREILYAPLRSLMKQIVIFILGTLILNIALVYSISSLFVRRIEKVSLSLKDISEGNGDLTQSIQVVSRDELSLLTRNFNNFVDLMRGMVTGIKQSADSTLGARDQLVVNTEETAAAINEISANMNSIEVQIKRLDESIVNSSRSVDNISGSVTGFNRIREEQAAMVEQTAASIAEMNNSLKQVAQISREKKEAADNLTETSRRGGEKLENLSMTFNRNVVTRLIDIEEMTDIIRGIAGQINLLSMNAAIEAAHAGESGKGFAVVADEIRKLAESSSDSVKTIDNAIREIRKGVDDTVENTNETAGIFKEMDLVVGDFVEALNRIANNTNELMTGSQEIDATSRRLNEITVNIKDSADLMKKGTQELTQEVVTIRDVSRTVLDGIQEAVVGTGQIVTAMDQVTALSMELASNSEDLKKDIDRFRT